MNKFRKWRVQTVKNGMKAPIFMVETMEYKEWEAKREASKKAIESSILLSQYGFDHILTEVEV